MFDELAERVNGNARLVARGRHVSAVMLLDAEADSVLVRIQDGAVVAVEKAPALMPAFTFALRAPREAWAKFLSAKPPVGYTDIFALQRKRLLRLEGDLRPFMANLLYFKDLLTSCRAEED